MLRVLVGCAVTIQGLMYSGVDQYSPQYYAPYGVGTRSLSTSTAAQQRYHPYGPSSRLAVPLHSNVLHDAVNSHHQMAYTANPQQYMKCKRAMCPSGIQVSSNQSICRLPVRRMSSFDVAPSVAIVADNRRKLRLVSSLLVARVKCSVNFTGTVLHCTIN